MCQAVWRSPLLPMLPESESGHSAATLNGFGTGNRFKRDLLAYLEVYGHKKTGPLVDQLEKYDFSAVRAGLIASVPSRQAIDELDSEKRTLWGWPALKDTIRQIPLNQGNYTEGKKPQIVIQVRNDVSWQGPKTTLLGEPTHIQKPPDIFSSNAGPNRQVAKGNIFRCSFPIAVPSLRFIQPQVKPASEILNHIPYSR